MENTSFERWYDQAKSALLLLVLAVGLLFLQEKVGFTPEPEVTAKPEITAAPKVARGPEALSSAICENYRVSCAETRRVLAVLMDEAVKHEIDTALAVGLALHESGFRPNAKSSTGDHGLLQVNYRWHRTQVKHLTDLYDVRVNSQVGLSYLKTLLSQADTTKAALRRYNGAGKKSTYPDDVVQKAQWVAQYI